ncbi:transcription termination factor 1 [Nematolebias whitei]|uniref:transcription termination factor 1 n=1 Tax=Nematolebias whitei TaxID=451745 RepID=UPI0018996FCF|nr:transcription termination factor 1 [Nematolebias whitei]
MVTTEVSASPHKKKKRKLEYVDSLPASVDVDAPEKKKKRVEEEQFNLHPANGLTQSPEEEEKKKKRRRRRREEEEWFECLEDSDVTIITSERKKKKKKFENLKDPPASVDINTPEEKKKKKRRAEEKEYNVHPIDGLKQRPEKKKMEECVMQVKSQTDKKKKQQMIVTMAALSPNHEETPVSTAFGTKGKKKKKVGDKREKKKKKKKKKEMSESLEDLPASVDIDAPEEEKKKKDGCKKEKKLKNNKLEEKTSTGEDVITSTEETMDRGALDELEEFIPDVKTRAPHEVWKFLRYDLHRFKKFKEQGVRVRRGRFSVKENQQLVTNISDFLALTGISSVDKLLYPSRFKEGKEIKKLRASHHFLESIAEGIPRPCSRVYVRARRFFDETNQGGRFSENEVATLRKLHHLHGNSWKAISEKMDRSTYALQKRFITLDADHGFWTEAEESRLKHAVREHLETLIQQGPPGSGLSLAQMTHNLPWMEVSHKVQTRCWTQCRKKWFYLLRNRLSPEGPVFGRGEGACCAKICLINTLYNLSVDDPAFIEWDKVAQAVGKVTPMCVQVTFNRLKCENVPNWTRLSYDEIITFMKLNLVPYLENKLKSQHRWMERRVQYGEDRYEITDIFHADEMDNGLPPTNQITGGQAPPTSL